MLQEVLSQELAALEEEYLKLDELDEVMAGGCGCRNAACAGACSGKGQTSKE